MLFKSTLERQTPENRKRKTSVYFYTDVLLVENSGIEPLTSCMPCKRSPS